MLLDDLFLRVELGYLLGSCAAAVVLLIGVPRHLRRHRLDAEEARRGASAPPAF
jgi:hypothetical protein